MRASRPGRESLWTRHLVGPDEFGIVLALLLLATLVLPGLTGGLRIVQGVLVGLTLVSALRAAGFGMTWTWRGAAVAAAAVGVIAVAGLAGADAVAPAVFALLLLYVIVIIARRLASHRHVTVQTVLGGITLYYLLSTIWAYLYSLADALLSRPLFVSGEVSSPFEYFYFSVVTLTTLGYGDLAPAENVGKSLAALEAFVGSVFLVTLVARLVSLWGHERPSSEEPETGR